MSKQFKNKYISIVKINLCEQSFGFSLSFKHDFCRIVNHLSDLQIKNIWRSSNRFSVFQLCSVSVFYCLYHHHSMSVVVDVVISFFKKSSENLQDKIKRQFIMIVLRISCTAHDSVRENTKIRHGSDSSVLLIS